MNWYKASNGIKVSTDILGGLKYDASSLVLALPAMYTQAAREFFQHERDEELGRWRWPENPDYVVYPRADHIQVVNERSGNACSMTRAQADTNTGLHQAGSAYFDAHPEPKPWHDAKPGEVWALSFREEHGDRETPWAQSRAGEWVTIPGNAPLAPGFTITAGRRIWPEVS